MSKSILILGESGTGKSTSLRNLPPSETFIVNVLGKSLPFRGSSKLYTPLSPDGLTGNYYCSDDPRMVRKVIHTVNIKRPDIKYLVIDDLGYVIMNSFMRKSLQKGYEKFTELGKEFADLIDSITLNLRDDLFCFVMMHVEFDRQGKSKPKTVGNMIDQYVCIEGKFTTVLHSFVSDGRYSFITNNDGAHMAKSPMGLFDNLLIENDLFSVAQEFNKYFEN